MSVIGRFFLFWGFPFLPLVGQVGSSALSALWLLPLLPLTRLAFNAGMGLRGGDGPKLNWSVFACFSGLT